MMMPTSRLAAPVTGSASAPISWISRGSERQSTERGEAAPFGSATAHRPVKSSASFDGAGEPRRRPRRGAPACRWRVAGPPGRPSGARDRGRSGAPLPACRPPRRACARPPASSRSRNRASRTAPAPSMRSRSRKVDIDRAAPDQPWLERARLPAPPPPRGPGRTDRPAARRTRSPSRSARMSTLIRYFGVIFEILFP